MYCEYSEPKKTENLELSADDTVAQTFEFDKYPEKAISNFIQSLLAQREIIFALGGVQFINSVLAVVTMPFFL